MLQKFAKAKVIIQRELTKLKVFVLPETKSVDEMCVRRSEKERESEKEKERETERERERKKERGEDFIGVILA